MSITNTVCLIWRISLTPSMMTPYPSAAAVSGALDPSLSGAADITAAGLSQSRCDSTAGVATCSLRHHHTIGPRYTRPTPQQRRPLDGRV